MPILRDTPTLSDIQRYVTELERERGFAAQDVLTKCLLLGEEVGELFKCVRRSQGIAIDPSSKGSAAADELADILIMLCSVANRLDVDLEAAFRKKEALNHGRKWVSARG